MAGNFVEITCPNCRLWNKVPVRLDRATRATLCRGCHRELAAVTPRPVYVDEAEPLRDWPDETGNEGAR